MAKNKTEQDYIDLLIDLMSNEFRLYVQKRQKKGENVNLKKAKKDFYDGLVAGTIKTHEPDAFKRAQTQANLIGKREMLDFAQKYAERNKKTYKAWLQKKGIKEGSILAKSNQTIVAFLIDASKVLNSTNQKNEEKKKKFQSECQDIEKETGIRFNLNRPEKVVQTPVKEGTESPAKLEKSSTIRNKLLEKLKKATANLKKIEKGVKNKNSEEQTIIIDPSQISTNQIIATKEENNVQQPELNHEDITDLVEIKGITDLANSAFTPYVAATDAQTINSHSDNWMDGLLKVIDKNVKLNNAVIKGFEQNLSRDELRARIAEQFAQAQAKMAALGLQAAKNTEKVENPVNSGDNSSSSNDGSGNSENKTTEDENTNVNENAGGNTGNSGNENPNGDDGNGGNTSEEDKEINLPGASSLTRGKSTEKETGQLLSLFDVVNTNGKDSSSFTTKFKQASTKKTYIAETIVSSKEKMNNNLLFVRDEHGAVLTLKESESQNKETSVVVREDLLSPAMREKLKDFAITIEGENGATYTEYNLPVESVSKTDTKITRYKIAGQSVTIDADPRNIVIKDSTGEIKPSVYNAGENCFLFEESEVLINNIFDPSNRIFKFIKDNSKAGKPDQVYDMSKSTGLNAIDPKYLYALIRNQQPGPNGAIQYDGPPNILYTTIYDQNRQVETPIMMIRDDKNVYIYGRDAEQNSKPEFMKIESVAFLATGERTSENVEVNMVINTGTKKPLSIAASMSTDTTEQINNKYKGSIPVDSAERNALAISAINAFTTPVKTNRNDKAVYSINGVEYYDINGVETNQFDSIRGYTEHKITENDKGKEPTIKSESPEIDNAPPAETEINPIEPEHPVEPNSPESPQTEDASKSPADNIPAKTKSKWLPKLAWVLFAIGAAICLAGTVLGLGGIPALVGLSIAGLGLGVNMASAITQSDEAVLSKAATKAKFEEKIKEREDKVQEKLNELSNDKVEDLEKLSKKERKAVRKAQQKLSAGQNLSPAEINKLNKIFSKRKLYSNKEDVKDSTEIATSYEPTTEVIEASMMKTAEATNNNKAIAEIINTDLLTTDEKNTVSKLSSNEPLTEADKEGLYRIIAREPILSDKTTFFGGKVRGEVTSDFLKDFARGYVVDEETRIAENIETTKKWMETQIKYTSEGVNPDSNGEAERTTGEEFYKMVGDANRSETQQLAVDIFNAMKDKLIDDMNAEKVVTEVEEPTETLVNEVAEGSVEQYTPEEEKTEYNEVTPENEKPAEEATNENNNPTNTIDKSKI